jgi:lipid A 3-O-deacylase
LSWLSAEGGVPDWATQGARYVPVFSQKGRLRVGNKLGQDIFTPDDITLQEQIPGQRPYAGWLYGGVGLVSDTGDRADNLALQVGIVGPASLAQDVQTTWHKWIGSPNPEG